MKFGSASLPDLLLFIRTNTAFLFAQAIQSSKAGMSAAGLLAKPPANALLGRLRATAGKR
jgi:hypothetical protein